MKYIPILICALAGCNNSAPENTSVEPTQEIWLDNQQKDLGIDFHWISGDSGTFNMPEIIGGGAALIDFDNDQDFDVYFVQGGHLDSANVEQNKMFRNDNGSFVDVTDESGTGDTGYGMGVTVGDYDNDGFADIFITNVGKNVLLHNNKDGSFTDVTDEANVGDTGWGASTAFLDVDSDGDLDLYVVNYLLWEHGLKIDCFNDKGMRDYCSPTNYMAPARDVLYRNNGDGSFSDMSVRSGLGTQLGTGLGLLCNDYTGDGRIDVFIANDGMADQLWKNNGDWTFTDVASLRACALDDEGNAKAGMGVTTEDFDHDGDFDIIVCNLFGESDSLYRNDGKFFTDITATKGIRTATRHATRFGLGWVDLNNDSILDIYEANGRVMQIGEVHTDDPFAELNYTLKGDSSGWTHIDAVQNDGIHTSRAAVFGDLNNDGGTDILVVNRDAQPYLLMNVHPNREHSITLRVLNKFGSDALGATVTATLGSVTITKPVQSTWSYLAANDPRIHIGLGEVTKIDDVVVRWIDGTTTEFGTFERGFHTLQQTNK